MRESGGSGASGTMASQNATAVAITGGTSAAAPTKTTMSAYVFSASNYGAIGTANANSQGSAPAIVQTAKARYQQTSTGTTITAQAGAYNVSPGMVTTNQPWTAWFRFRTGSTLTNQGLWIGITSAQGAFNTRTPPTNSLLALYQNGTDTQLVATGRAAGGATTGSAFGPTLQVNTSYMMKIRFDGTTAYFSCYAGEDIDGDFGTEVAMATVPAAGTFLGYQVQAGNLVGGAGTSSDFCWSLIQVQA